MLRVVTANEPSWDYHLASDTTTIGRVAKSGAQADCTLGE